MDENSFQKGSSLNFSGIPQEDGLIDSTTWKAFLHQDYSLHNFLTWLNYFVTFTGQIVVDTKTVIRIPGLEDYFTIENVHIVQPESCIYLSFTHKCVPCGTLFKHCRTVMFQTAYEEIFGKEMFSKLLTGQIISKPWKNQQALKEFASQLAKNIRHFNNLSLA